MLYSSEILLKRAEDYCQNHRLTLGHNLGHGLHGIVVSTTRESAVKIHAEPSAYIRERDVYRRLQERNVRHIRELIVPYLYQSDDNLLIIEMTLVSPPFIVDFGGAYLDAPPAHFLDHPLREQWAIEKQEQFDANWAAVSEILADFERLYGIFIVDVNPGNIRFGIASAETS